jgi:nucleoid DNA-binding protein
MRKYLSLTALFKGYSFKHYDMTPSSTVHLPYVAKAERKNGHKLAVDFKTWKLIITTYFEVFKEILFQGHKIKLPHGLGDLFLSKRKARGVNWKESKAQNKAIYFKNRHTEGYKPNIRWMKTGPMFKHSGLWRVKAAEAYKEEIADFYKSNGYKIKHLSDG